MYLGNDATAPFFCYWPADDIYVSSLSLSCVKNLLPIYVLTIRHAEYYEQQEHPEKGKTVIDPCALPGFYLTPLAPLRPRGRVHIGLNKNRVRSGCVSMAC